ncbi:MAG: 30S ribosome-binding factor RbfA [Acidobacteria bacterium]|nr:30S ribosome-binding factor RbfA [Acidobacteriota bacterium]
MKEHNHSQGHSHRPERIADQIRHELAMMLERDVKDPRIGFVTITGVRVTPDMGTARVGVTVLGDEEKKAESLKGLEAASGFLRSELARRLQLRRTPALRFEFDELVESERRIEEMLQKLRKD